MKAEYINPFLAATQDVFKQMLGMDIEKRKIELREDFVDGQDANVLIGVIGALQGSVVYCFPKSTALAIVKSMAASALGEIGNIISGNALSRLAQANYHCDIAPPQIILGGNKSISMASSKYLFIPITCQAGDMAISVMLREKA
jgi:chemotaxis protein CheX